MYERKCENRTMYSIGREQFNFDLQKEKGIYGYLYGIRRTEKEWRKLRKAEKFYCYSEWKKYIWNKYKDYEIKELQDFSMYLNQRIRNEKPNKEYLSLFIPVFLSILIGKMPEMIDDLQKIDFSGVSKGAVLLMIVVIAILVGLIIGLVWEIFIPIWDNNINENLFVDYKKIIDELIEYRLMKEKKQREKNKKKKLNKK